MEGGGMGGRGGQINVTKCHQGGGGSTKCGKSVMYYLISLMQLPVTKSNCEL